MDFGLGMDLGMDMGMDMGMGMGMDMGMGLGMDVGMGMGMGMGMGLAEDMLIADTVGMGMGMGMGMGGMYGGYGGRQQIIINNGGMYPRQQIIINNGGGMYPRMNQEVIIANSSPYNNAVVINKPRHHHHHQRIVQVQQPTQYVQRPVQQQVVYQQPQQVAYQQPQQVSYQQPQQNIIKQQQQQQQQVQQQQKRDVDVQSNYFSDAQYAKMEDYPTLNEYESKPKCYQQFQKQQQVEQFFVELQLSQLQFGNWSVPREFKLSHKRFERYNLIPINKIKCRTNYQPYSDQLQHGENIFKIVADKTEVYFAAMPESIKEYFYYMAMMKAKCRINEMPRFQVEIAGPIIRKSGLFGGWEPIFAKIVNKEGLKLYKNPSHHHITAIKSVRELWTRFQIVQAKYLVIKIKHNSSKLEFGVPLSCCGPWIDAFYSLLQTYT